MEQDVKEPRYWVVLSPQYEAVGDDYYEPPETVRDVLYVRATTSQRAKVLAIRRFRRGWWKGCITNRRAAIYPQPYIVRYHDENPLAVLTVEPADEECAEWHSR